MNYRVPSSPTLSMLLYLWIDVVSSYLEAFLFLGLCSADLRLFSRYQLIAHINQFTN